MDNQPSILLRSLCEEEGESHAKPGTVKKVIESPFPEEPEKAQFDVDGADHLYREIRIENTLEDEKGNKVKLKQGAEVDVTVEADPKATIPKGADDGRQSDVTPKAVPPRAKSKRSGQS